MSDAVDALAALLGTKGSLEWEVLIIGDWPEYSVSQWPKARHAPFAPILPPEDWCERVRADRRNVMDRLRTSGRTSALEAAEARAISVASTVAVHTAGAWADMLGLPMHVQAARSVLLTAALYPVLSDAEFAALWEPYSSVAGYLRPFAQEHFPRRSGGGPTVKSGTDGGFGRAKSGLFARLLGRR
jgi:hypothetical protein